MISVVIPAHNEALVIGALLDCLDPGIGSGDLEVVVVANGCVDDTASIGRAHAAEVIELPDGSKTAALRAGDATATSFPRFYIDADIRIKTEDLLLMAKELTGSIGAVAPRLDLDSSGANWAVRSYHRVWIALPSVSHSLAGRGCFGVSEGGRGRWDEWPDVVADDQFANQIFNDNEKRIHDEVFSTVRMPANTRRLIGRKRRSHRGNVELESGGGSTVISSTAWLGVVRSDPRRMVDIPAYLAVTLSVRVLAKIDQRRGTTSWNSDRSSRER